MLQSGVASPRFLRHHLWTRVVLIGDLLIQRSTLLANVEDTLMKL